MQLWHNYNCMHFVTRTGYTQNILDAQLFVAFQKSLIPCRSVISVSALLACSQIDYRKVFSAIFQLSNLVG